MTRCDAGLPSHCVGELISDLSTGGGPKGDSQPLYIRHRSPHRRHPPFPVSASLPEYAGFRIFGLKLGSRCRAATLILTRETAVRCSLACASIINVPGGLRRSASAACGSALRRAYRPHWRRGRVAEGGGLLNRYRVVKPYRGFESLRLRQFPWPHRATLNQLPQ